MKYAAYLLPVSETIQAAWEKVGGSKKSFWAAIGVSILIAFGIGLVAGLLSNISDLLAGLVNFIGQIISTLISMGILYMGIQRAKNAPINYKQMFYAFESPIAIRIIGVYVIQFLIFFPLTLLFIFVPMVIFGNALGDTFSSGLNAANFFLVSWILLGVLISLYITLRLLLSMAFVLDQKSTSWTAIKQSYFASRGNEWRLLAILFFQILTILIGGLLLGIGLIWAIPYTMILYGLTYKNLLANLNSVKKNRATE